VSEKVEPVLIGFSLFAIVRAFGLSGEPFQAGSKILVLKNGSFHYPGKAA
jgi:hypothetical protein